MTGGRAASAALDLRQPVFGLAQQPLELLAKPLVIHPAQKVPITLNEFKKYRSLVLH
jgi:hypothetical protein